MQAMLVVRVLGVLSHLMHRDLVLAIRGEAVRHIPHAGHKLVPHVEAEFAQLLLRDQRSR